MSATQSSIEPTAAVKLWWAGVGLFIGLTVFGVVGALGVYTALGVDNGFRIGAILGTLAAGQISVVAGRFPLYPLTFMIVCTWCGALAPLLARGPGTIIAVRPLLLGGVVGACLGLAIAHGMMRTA